MKSTTVTSALKEVLSQLGIQYKWTYSDSRKPRGFKKAVGVKLVSSYLSGGEILAVQAAMQTKGFILLSAKLADYRALKARYPHRYVPFGGTRLTFAKPEWKKA